MPEDYGKTLNLPNTDFPMRANLPQREPEVLKKWNNEKLYEAILEKNKNKPSFILHDGPPYANGDIHCGHTLNKILKDIIIRFKNMDGYCAPFVPGWDTHGLPIERQAIKKLGINRHEAGPVKFREACKEFAEKYVSNQREQFKRLGVIGDWENPYLTMKPEFEAEQIKIFGEMAKKGYIYKGLKPVYWCPTCETALAEAEIEYAEDKTASIFVKFLTKDDKGLFEGLGKVYFVIWTTTTWTLPGNVAISLNANFEYSLVKVAEDETYVLATELIDSVCEAAGIESYEVVKTFKGRDLELMTTQHPFIDRESVVIVGDHVTLDAGTGCVHTAPGHGVEDFVVCQNYKDIPIIVPVDDKGYLNELAGEFNGLYYAESNEKILEKLKEVNALLAVKEIVHQYPHCWRCNDPIIFRATEQWFASVEGFRKEALDAIKSVNWIPKWGEDKISNMVADRSDWCISRQRIWGVPIPIFYCKDCGKPLVNDDTINAIYELFKVEGSDAWWTHEALDILPKGTKCECGCGEFTKEKDTMDVWFDSGSSYKSVLAREGHYFPADLYLEGNDQYRGWFQSSLLTSVATAGCAPYKEVLTHGFVLDKNDEKMSKSKGNGISPLDLIKQYGADVVRLWVISADYKCDVRISMDILKQMSEAYRKIRNTARFILGNIDGFDPNKDMVKDSELFEIDKYILSRLGDIVEKCIAAYRNYDFHIIYHTIHNFCVVDLSNLYLDVVKDRLYTEKADSVGRRAAQTAMYKILDALVRLLAPAICYTAEEIWQFMPHLDSHDVKSVMLNDMPKAEDYPVDAELCAKWEKIIAIKNDVAKALELARNEKIIGHSLGAKVVVYADGENLELLKAIEKDLVTYLIVSYAEAKELANADEKAIAGETGIKTMVCQAPGEKCERCWMYSETVGKDSAHPTLCARCAEALK
ncbi:MAG: isoleucine--tRNA ligase [Clostridia bacterium]|nr:isoleucine--tRNA ligase [Clostridia bacterium]